MSGAERAQWVARYRASGMGLKRFAAAHRLAPGQLHYWVYAPGPASAGEPGPPVFQEVRLSDIATRPKDWAAELLLPGGVSVRLREGTDARWTAALVQAMGGACSH